MIPLERQKVLDTPSAQLFSEAKKLLADHRILCDFSIVYRDHAGQRDGMRHLYVRDTDYGAAREILRSLAK